MMGIRSMLAAWVLLAGAAASAQELVLSFDPARTSVAFTVSSALHTVHGTFHFKSGSMQFDTVTGVATGELVVDARSGASGSDGRDSRMHKSVLESMRFPEVTFRPDHVEGTVALTGDSDVRVHGRFGIHGAEHEVVLPAHVHMEAGAATATIHFGVPYVAWGMKDPSNFLLKVSNTVNLELEAAAKVTVKPGT
jgi:polyisoprenoid-binding protein YceI